MNWYLTVLKKYAVFEGRSRRKEYWFFVLISTIVGSCFIMIDRQMGNYDPETQVGFLHSLYSLLVLLPTVALSVRRLHDTGRSGWWLLLLFLPIIGWIVLLIFYVLKGDEGSNRFGQDPVA
ncbi:hypothetical protein A3742_09140 [Oleiphilus sp. HI0071]|jgi:uncharacterized membrane protein YhaH (DUF805 family)|uniref:DUF805 domain-containing protein n=1 Tax=unclassified Oleiphilus TaxID=2631174 RepID=UPI0007C3F0D5|nr:MULTISPECIES: DUF805 domain-containing protein [unclassified Oleiphilus]KZY60199.1 hypothetical protein A3737_07225 [Oleiphilus sp. HI0065]KZY82511.1 hypothetical protein A3742_09140 [Oleiphilus sp. HI0071]KZY92850.1 hypothetical protein A3744_14335 [Oleiphilus sp. HI0073]KZZ44784.1 hypothetical protein A3758_02190 [Oleiphilus sp. HI0118]KZZ49685.1 hypothetical protein A3760_14930 [Oleiphilus sp. HI0122]KZZ73681.1 hypothetical protein A3765_26830 [Oleiphilus sp. HI0130]KZZ78836.1 hypothet